MKAKVVILETGEITIITQEGSFRTGVKSIEKLLSSLNSVGLNISLTKPPEQHRHDDPETNHTHQSDKA